MKIDNPALTLTLAREHVQQFSSFWRAWPISSDNDNNKNTLDVCLSD